MPRGDKSSYTDKQKRQAEHIEEGYEQLGVSPRKPSGAPGRRSTRKPVAARRERVRPRQEGQPRFLAQRRTPGRPRRGEPAGGCTLAFGEKGGGNAQAACLTLSLSAETTKYRTSVASAALLNRNSGIAEAFPLHQRKQNGGIGRMQPDAPA